MICKPGRPVKDLESLNKHDVSDTISIYFLSLIPGTCWDINDDTSRFTSDDALRRWQPPLGWPHASSSLVEGRGIPKTARDLLYHKTAREWRVHPIMKLETYFYNLIWTINFPSTCNKGEGTSLWPRASPSVHGPKRLERRGGQGQPVCWLGY